jgi:hypothetical protein
MSPNSFEMNSPLAHDSRLILYQLSARKSGVPSVPGLKYHPRLQANTGSCHTVVIGIVAKWGE